MIWTDVQLRGPYLINGTTAPETMAKIQPGDPLILMREPGNPCAVQVSTVTGVTFGYVAAEVAPHMDRGLVPVARCTKGSGPSPRGVDYLTFPECFIQIDEKGEETDDSVPEGSELERSGEWVS